MFPIWPNRLPEMGGLVGREKNIKSSQHLGCSPQRLDAAAVMRAPGSEASPGRDEHLDHLSALRWSLKELVGPWGFPQ